MRVMVGTKFLCESQGNLVDGQNSKRSNLAKLRGWSPMDLPVKWHFSAYKFDTRGDHFDLLEKRIFLFSIFLLFLFFYLGLFF